MQKYNQTYKPKSMLSKIVWVLWVLIVIATAGATLLSYLAPVVDPYTFWYVSFLGIGGQILILANLLCLLIMAVKMSKWALLPLTVFLLGMGYVGDFLQFNILTKYDQDKKPLRNELKIMTYNVHGFFKSGSSTNYSSTLDSIVSYICRENPDIICMQEYQLINAQDHSAIHSQMGAWRYRVLSSLVNDNFHEWGLAIFSKLPLSNARQIKFVDRANSSMYVDVHVADTIFRLFNSHLQSTKFNTLNRKELEAKEAEQAARQVGHTLRQNSGIRAFQADTIAGLIAQSPYPTVVVGDFNDTPMSYVYHTIRGDMKDTFREKGEGYEYTYKPLKGLFRIDYILHSEGIKTLSHNSPFTPWSDHKPVISRIKIEK